MKESRVFELDQVTAEQVLEAVTTFLRSEKGMEVQSVATPNGYLIQAAQADTLRTLSGMKLATTVELTVNGTQLNVTLGEGQWADKLGAGEILLTSMDCDGTKAGFDNELTALIAEHVSVPVIASGGAGNKEHFYDALTVGKADAALAASLFHYKELEIMKLKKYLACRGLPVRL